MRDKFGIPLSVGDVVIGKLRGLGGIRLGVVKKITDKTIHFIVKEGHSTWQPYNVQTGRSIFIAKYENVPDSEMHWIDRARQEL